VADSLAGLGSVDSPDMIVKTLGAIWVHSVEILKLFQAVKVFQVEWVE